MAAPCVAGSSLVVLGDKMPTRRYRQNGKLSKSVVRNVLAAFHEGKTLNTIGG